MTSFFVDTSALVKRYINEHGSPWIMSWITRSSGNIVIVSELTSIELFSASARRERERTLLPALAQTIRDDFLYHFEHEYLVIELDRSIIAKARELSTLYQLRALDSIQLSCAFYAAKLNPPITFICADFNLLTAASAEGFAIDNPNQHLSAQ